jgi:hypothetical protein
VASSSMVKFGTSSEANVCGISYSSSPSTSVKDYLSDLDINSGKFSSFHIVSSGFQSLVSPLPHSLSFLFSPYPSFLPSSSPPSHFDMLYDPIKDLLPPPSSCQPSSPPQVPLYFPSPKLPLPLPPPMVPSDPPLILTSSPPPYPLSRFTLKYCVNEDSKAIALLENWCKNWTFTVIDTWI